MDVLTRTSPTPRSREWLWWLPLVVIFAAFSCEAAGVRAVSGAFGANVIVSGAVDKDVSIDASGCSGSALALGSLTVGDPMIQTASTCSIAFSSNSALGADLQLSEDATAPAVPADAMKCTTGGCSGDALDDYTDANFAGDTGSHFGAQFMTANGAAAGMVAASPNTVAVAAPLVACQSSAVGPGTCGFRFAASADASDRSGSYQALVQFTVAAR